MGAANNGSQNSSNTSDPKKKWTNKKKNWNRNNNKSKGKGFSGTAKDGPLAGIILATDRTVPLLGLVKKFLECLQAYANDKGMEHVAHCIKHMEDLGINDFLSEEVNMSDCTSMMDARKLDSKGALLQDINRNIIMEQVKLITNRELFDSKIKLQKHRTRNKEDKYKTFKKD